MVDKPAGLLTSTVPREKRPTLLAAVRRHVEDTDRRARVGLIHRLDRDASGLLVFSKCHQAYLSLKQQFFEHSVERIYLAVVHGAPKSRDGTIDTHLVERADGSVYSTDRRGVGARAVTHYQTVSERKGSSLLRVKLETGKKHQIRVHLAEQGAPIMNDPMYGRRKPEGRMMLMAAELTLLHPRKGRRMTFKLDPPADFGFVAETRGSGDGARE